LIRPVDYVALLALLLVGVDLGACSTSGPSDSTDNSGGNSGDTNVVGAGGTGGDSIGTGGTAVTTGMGGVAQSDGGAGGAGGMMGCGTGEWPTYGHDTQRTSASDGCMKGPLKAGWSYFPHGFLDSNIVSVDNTVTSGQSVFMRFTSTYGPQMDGLSTAGQMKWTWAGPKGRDTMTQHWAAAGMGQLMVADDGLFLVDQATGMNKTINEYDDWGQVAADDKRFYINSELDSPDGPGLYTGAYSATGQAVWKQDAHKKCDGISEKHGSLAVDGGKLYRSGVYSNGGPPASGIAVYDATTGAPGWKVATTPASAISIGGGHIYLVEDTGTVSLVARQEADGSVAWTEPLAATPASTQAPVVAGDLVIIATASDIRAFNAASGATAWTVPNVVAPVGDKPGSSPFNTGVCAMSIAWAAMSYSSIAAALGSGSLVVTAKDAVHIISLTDGSDLWHGTPMGITGPMRNPVIVGHTLYAVDLGSGKTGRLFSMTSP
jgi:hypothetical protein